MTFWMKVRGFGQEAACFRTPLTVLRGSVDARHGAAGQNLEVVANPDPAVEQLLLDPFSDWMRSRTCFRKR